jgi:hypothetical protein
MDLAGLLEAAIVGAIEKQNTYSRILAPITKRNLFIVKRIVEEASIKNINLEWRHVNLASKLFPRFVIRDEEEVLYFISPKEDSSIDSKEDTGLWTNCRAFVYAQKAFFEELWDGGMSGVERIRQIEQVT